MKRNLYVGALFLILLVALLAASSILQKKAAVEAAGVQAPRFEVDPLWPKPLPNHWLQGQTIGVSVDDKDHIWIIHRAGSLEPGEQHAATNPPIAQCCAPAPPSSGPTRSTTSAYVRATRTTSSCPSIPRPSGAGSRPPDSPIRVSTSPATTCALPPRSHSNAEPRRESPNRAPARRRV